MDSWTYHEVDPSELDQSNQIPEPDSNKPRTAEPCNQLKTIWLSDLLIDHPNSSSVKRSTHSSGSSLKWGLKEAHISTFGYDWTRASGEGQMFEKDLIKPVAMELLKAVNGGREWDEFDLNSEDQTNGLNKVPLVFVALDIGGTIVKEV